MASGNTYLLKLRDAVTGEFLQFCGQMEASVTVGGTPIDVTNKCSGGFIEYLEGFRAGKQIVFTGTVQMQNTSEQLRIKEAAENGTFLEAQVHTGVGGEYWEGAFAVTRSDTGPLNASTTMSLTFSSSGQYFWTPPTLPGE